MCLKCGKEISTAARQKKGISRSPGDDKVERDDEVGSPHIRETSQPPCDDFARLFMSEVATGSKNVTIHRGLSTTGAVPRAKASFESSWNYGVCIRKLGR